MKLTTDQEALLVILVAVADYKTDKYYGKGELLDKIGDLDMEENGFYMDERVSDFEALKTNKLIKFEYEREYEYELEDGCIVNEEEGEDATITCLEILDKGRDYVKHMNDPKKLEKIWEYVKRYLGNVNVNIDSIIKVSLF